MSMKQKSVYQQTRALLCKNFLKKWRMKRESSLEWGLSILLGLCLGLFSNFLRSVHFPETPPHDLGRVDQFNRSFRMVVYTPISNVTQQIMNKTAFAPLLKGERVIGVPNEKHMDKILAENAPHAVGIIFNDAFSYKLKFVQGYDIPVLSDEDLSAHCWEEYEEFHCLLTSYWDRGFVTLQTAINAAIIEITTNHSVMEDLMSVTATNMKTLPFISKDGLQNEMFILYCSLYFSPLIYFVSLNVTKERKKCKDLMKMMGLQDSAFWLSWGLIYAGFNFIISILITIIITSTQIIVMTGFMVIFTLFFLYGLSLIALVFLMSVLLKKAVLTNLVVFLLTLFWGCLGFTVLYKQLPSSLEWILSICSPFAFTAGMIQVKAYECRYSPLFFLNSSSCFQHQRADNKVIEKEIDPEHLSDDNFEPVAPEFQGKELEEIRKITGICPQHNVQFDMLTVKENLNLFAKIKGIHPQEVEQEVQRILLELDMQNIQDNLAEHLSEGQKRKLTFGIAILGDPQVRHFSFGILNFGSSHRKVIMSNGRLKCAGSSIFLKRKWGLGYHLSLYRNETCDPEQITSFINHHIPGAKLKTENEENIVYTLPLERTNKFPDLFSALDKYSAQGVMGYDVSMSTLNEVFMKLEGKSTIEQGKKTTYEQLCIFPLILETIRMIGTREKEPGSLYNLGDILLEVDDFKNRNGTDGLSYNGAIIVSGKQKDYRFSLVCNTKRLHCFPILMNIISNGLLRMFNHTQYIRIERSPYPLVIWTGLPDGSIFLFLILCSTSPYIAMSSISDYKKKAKSQLWISGLYTSAYWCGQALVDINFFIFILLLMYFIFYIEDVMNVYTTSKIVLAMVIITPGYAASLVFLAYVISFIFRKRRKNSGLWSFCFYFVTVGKINNIFKLHQRKQAIQAAVKNTERGVLLTTHCLAEAEALCDRVAIMVSGRLRCIGSIQHLKNKLGKDYTLELKVKETSQVTLVHTEILKLFPQALLIMEKYSLPVMDFSSPGLENGKGCVCVCLHTHICTCVLVYVSMLFGKEVDQKLNLKFLGGISTSKKQEIKAAIFILAQCKCNRTV
uniref:Uncharacterized protein n=1 Tax=Propithecus coquereli TaxID=379532 RepID=A0A2K6F5C9_PROCO